MKQGTRTTFFNLPAELRNNIYELVVFHHETNGIISPVIPSCQDVALIDGTRYVVCNGYPQFEAPSRRIADPQRLRERTEARQRQEEAFKLTSNSISNHYCTPMCLLQPEASKVNRQMREEALGVFYGLNHIHFEMGNFHVTSPGGQICTRESWFPSAWWRAVGDTNLRRCGRLSIVCHPSVQGVTGIAKSHLMIDFSNHGTNEVRITPIDPLPHDGVDRTSPISLGTGSAYGRYRLRKRQRSPDWERTVVAYVDVIKECGLHVRVLEHLIIALEPCDAEYMADHNSLDSDLQIGVVMEGRGERALRWRPF